MEKLITQNNVINSWLDDHESTKLGVLLAVVLFSIIGASSTSNPVLMVLAILPTVIIGVARWYYVVKGTYVGKR